MWNKIRNMSQFCSRDLSCKKFQQISSEFLDGDLGPRMLWSFNYHAERCKWCSAFLSTIQATISVLRSLPYLEAPQELKQRIGEQPLLSSSDAESST
jgi:hypothetical protein